MAPQIRSRSSLSSIELKTTNPVLLCTAQVDNDFNFAYLLPASVLGFRHGLDWDHIAAIADVTTAPASTATARQLFAFLKLPMLYAVGHITSIAAPALLARTVTQHLPAWLDPVMEKVVGFTLLVIGLWLAVSIIRDFIGRREPRIFSRWQLLASFLSWFGSKLNKHHHERRRLDLNCPPSAAFGLGILHGIGAETGTQIILIAAVSGSSKIGAVSVLLAFALGLLISNAMVALGIAVGMMKASHTRLLSAAMGLGTALFSIVIGTCFIAGTADRLPSFADCVPTGGAK